MSQIPHSVPLRFTPAADVLGHTAPLDHEATFPLLGVLVAVCTNSPAVLAAAERSFGGWRGLEPDVIEPVPPLALHVLVHPGQRGEERPEGLVYRAHGDCFLAAGGSNLLTAQRDRGYALAFVTPELLAADLVFCREVLECLALLLVGRHDRTPLHAAAVVRNDRPVVLAGPSGAGKSTLCYACLQAGFQLLAEEVVYVSTAPGLRLWGIPWQLHLRPDATALFPELAGRPAQLLPTGERKLVIDVASFGADRCRRHAERPVVCLLRRHYGARSKLEPIERRAVVEAFARERLPGFDLYPEAGQRAGALAEQGAYLLTVGTDLAGAVEQLVRLTD